MKQEYKISQQLMALILLASLFLQGCGNSLHPVIPIPIREVSLKHTPSSTNHIQPLIGQELTAQGGNVVTFYEEAGELRATVEMNAPQGFSKTYAGLSVTVEQGAELATLPYLSKQAQEYRIQLQLAQGNQPAKIVIYKGAGLAGGMEVNEEDLVSPVETRVNVNKTRKGLKLEKNFQETLLSQLPEGYRLGVAYDNGDCFFDALAQWLNKIEHTNINNTVKSLRLLCHEFYQENESLVDVWNQADYGGIDKGKDEYYMVQYTAEECERYFHGRAPIWGRPSVEGQMLCKKLNLKDILSIEVLKDPETGNPVISYHLTTPNEYKSSIDEEEGRDSIELGDVLIIINVEGKQHFVPLLKSQINHTHLQLAQDSQPAKVVIYKGVGQSDDEGEPTAEEYEEYMNGKHREKGQKDGKGESNLEKSKDTEKGSINTQEDEFTVVMGRLSVEEENKQIINLHILAEQGDADAQCNLGIMYGNGYGVVQDDKEAFEWYKKAAVQGDAIAQCNLGRMYENGYGVVEKDEVKAFEWYKKAAVQGHANAQNNLGIMYGNGYGVAQDDKEAFEWFKKAADQEDANAQCNLGIMYKNGRGVRKNETKTFEWFKRAADQGYTDAQNDLGIMYEAGQGVAQNYSKAFEWYKKAADQGNAIAQNNLGWMYDNGHGVEKDEVKAFEWFKKAAVQGHAEAQCNLGWMYNNGHGVEKDEVKAFEWFKKAAVQGHAIAQNSLGCMYDNGYGVDKNDKKIADKNYINLIRRLQEVNKNEGEDNPNEILDEIILELAEKCLDHNTRSEAREGFEIFLKALKEKAINLSLKNLQYIQKILYKFWKEDHPGEAGVGVIKVFIESLKEYVPRRRDYDPNSQGDSESENPSIVYRALTKDETPERGLFSKGRNKDFRLRKHISPLQGQIDRATQSPWISTTRSLKVAAAWASESSCKSIAKIQLGPEWKTEECDHSEPCKKRFYDFTQQEDRSLIFGDSNNQERNTVVASQEVAIYKEVPKENILGLYTAGTLSEEDYKKLKDAPKEDLANMGIHSTFKTRKLKNDVPLPRIIKRIKVMEEIGGRQQTMDPMEEEITELAENLSQTLQVDQETTGSKDKGKEKDEEEYTRSEVGPSRELYSQEGSILGSLEKKVLQLARQAIDERILRKDTMETTLADDNIISTGYKEEIDNLKEDILNPVESEILQTIRKIKQEAVMESMNCLISNVAPNGKIIVESIEEALKLNTDTLHLELTDKSLTEQDLNFLTYHPFFKNICKEVKLSIASSDSSSVGILVRNLQGTNIHTLDISHNCLLEEDIIDLSKVLPQTKIYTLDIGHNYLKDKELLKLFKVLSYTKIHTLYLHNNYISDAGVIALAKHLKGSCIHTLNLMFNFIGDKGAKGLAKRLKGTKIYKVYLGHNLIGTDVQTLLKEQYLHIKWKFKS